MASDLRIRSGCLAPHPSRVSLPQRLTLEHSLNIRSQRFMRLPFLASIPAISGLWTSTSSFEQRKQTHRRTFWTMPKNWTKKRGRASSMCPKWPGQKVFLSSQVLQILLLSTTPMRGSKRPFMTGSLIE